MMEQKQSENIPQKKRKGGIVLIGGIVLTLLWMWIFPEYLYPLWKNFTFLPDPFYFPIEEFLALNGHYNSPVIYIGGFILLVGTLIWSLKLNGRLQKSYEYILLAAIIMLLAAMILPCMCVSREVGRRLRCTAHLKEAYCKLSLYSSENNGLLPDKFVISDSKHQINYYGKNRSLREKTFVLFEDAVRCHAGDLRHQMLSNGEIRRFYPWKNNID